MKEEIKKICEEKNFREKIIDILFRMTEVDTTPSSDIFAVRANEEKCFSIIREYLSDNPLDNAVLRNDPVSPEIKRHKAYTSPYYTVTPENPAGLPPEQAYSGRYNLLYLIDSEPSPRSGRNAALNAHIDTVAPFYPPEIKGNFLYGRGACDDKANVAVILGALRVLARLCGAGHVGLKNKITAMFVIEEETGGNGSLSLVLSETIKKRCDSVLVLEACDKNIHPANRGAVWFKCVLRPEGESAAGSGRAALLQEAAAGAVLEMQREGERIKGESEHPLFPHRPVQTCNGILGPFGEHPSRICAEVSFRVISEEGPPGPELKKAIEKGARKYARKYGDKTGLTDPATGKPKMPGHYSVTREGERSLIVKVYGSTGHMGAILENDDAIVKWAMIMEELAELKTSIRFETELEGTGDSNTLMLEGGQGFLPTHTIEEIQERMKEAAVKGAEKSGKEVSVEVTYDKLHNAAYGSDPDSGTMRTALRAGVETGIIQESDPVRGWDVSCDARLFAELGLPVLTSGCGDLKAAHSNSEYVNIPDIFRMINFTALFLLKETGAVNP